jgi:D-alanyl-D-alanine carboxypeptidase/D-alanyl-D-alanine-endopeptidase (penicillin-binding protein 4)
MQGLRGVFATIATAMIVAFTAAPATAIGLDDGGRTPVARPGSPAAATRALSGSQLRTSLSDALSAAGGASGAWVYDIDANDQPTLFSEQANEARIPASNQKLFTTAAFLTALGPDSRLETRVFVRGGDLVIVGDGDPAFGTTRFARANDQPVTRVSELARSIAAAGIKKVSGRVLADDTIFDRERRAGPYLSPLSGLSFNDGYDGGGYAGAPELVAAEGLKRALRKRGVRVSGRVGHANLPPKVTDGKPLASVASPTVARLIEETNVPSNNFFAEMLLKRLAAEGGKRGTRARGARKVEAFADSVGSGDRAADGSGLSRRNRVSPQQVGELLVAMATDTDSGPAFEDSLPVAGREGTLADRMRGTAAEGNCAAKTGSLSDVSALSGYCTAAGHTIAFSVLNNSVSVDAARRAQDAIAAAIARYQP